MGFRHKYDRINKALIPVLPGASTVSGFIASSDVGKLCLASSNNGLLAAGSTADFGPATGVLGIVASVPTATTPGSTVPFYVAPILPGEVIEADYSTSYEGSTGVSVIATSNIGKFMTWGNAVTVASGAHIDPSLAGNAAGTTNALFFRLRGFSTQNDTVFGTINSTHLAL